jgi:hypothetical protein
MGGMEDRLREIYKHSDDGISGINRAQTLGEVGSAIATKKLGLKPITPPFIPRTNGFDDILVKGDKIYIIEAKGATSRLSTVVDGHQQMSKRWINERIESLKVGSADERKIGELLEKARGENKLHGMVVTTPAQGNNAFRPVVEELPFDQIGGNRWIGPPGID